MSDQRIRVLFLGETWAVTKIHTKGFDTVQLGGFDDMSVYLKGALETAKDIEVTHLPNHRILSDFPESQEELDKYDVVIVSDTGRNTLTMYPDMFTVPMGPNRLKMIKQFVEKGGGFIMAGGYVCYQGFQGKGNYHDSEIEEILPVHIKDKDDRVESPEGVRPRITNPSHELLSEIPSDDWPIFLGYNQLMAKDESTVLSEIKESDPFIAVWEFGNGRTMAFASDLAPHWGTDFVTWDYYDDFWQQSIRWLVARS